MNDDDITRGTALCQLWHFVGKHVVAPYKVTPGHLLIVKRHQTNAARRSVMYHIISVIEAAKAINRMMERPEMYGLNNEVTK